MDSKEQLLIVGCMVLVGGRITHFVYIQEATMSQERYYQRFKKKLPRKNIRWSANVESRDEA
jgi:hypothetical protein